MSPTRFVPSLSALWLCACTANAYAVLPKLDEGESGADGLADESTGEGSSDEGDPEMPPSDDPSASPACTIPPDQLEGLLPCGLDEPSEVIAPVTRWTWSGSDGEDSVVTTPLVANLDDDNDDGFVDLCDTPDIVVAAVDLPPGKTDLWPAGHLHVIDGDSGASSQVIAEPIDAAINPALADLDGDGRAEILALQASGPNSPYTISSRRLVAFDASGELLWAGEHWQASRGGGAISIADLDGDGSPEILAPEYVAHENGELWWAPPSPPQAYSMPIAADLDLDGDLEVLFGGSAYTHAGEWLFDAPTVPQNRGSAANFDGDAHPEIYVQYEDAHAVLEHDGALLSTCPTGTQVAGTGSHPVAAHDLDEDGDAELLFSHQDTFYVLGVEAGECVVLWSQKIDASDAISSGTFFDFLGDGDAEAVYADRTRVRLYGSAGELLFELPRSARASIGNPVVADVDGDGAAEILVGSSEPLDSGGDELTSAPTLVVLENADDRFAPTRRIWNQHTYHHTNVGEDARVPIHEPPHWQLGGGFRSNTRSWIGEECIPPPQGGQDP